MMYIHMHIAYFLTGTINLQVLWGKKKYLLNSLYEKLSIVSWKQMQTVKNVSLPRTTNKLKFKYIAVSFSTV